MDSLRKEAQTLASLNHERIVRVYDVFESHGSIFYVMPWLEGGSLRERMDEAASGKSTITPEQAAEWLLLLLGGLDLSLIHILPSFTSFSASNLE